MIEDGFTDLRLNQQQGQNEDSFWPSFTDIMTVIVMIFMIAMVILLVRNLELVRQLRATMEAERSAVELARSTGEEKASLALRLIATENQLSMLKIKAMQLDETGQQQQHTIGTQGEEISRLTAQNESLTLHRDQLSAENYTLNERLAQAEKRLASLQNERKGLRDSLQASRQQQQDMERLLADTQADLSNLDKLQGTLQQQLDDLQRRYSQLAQVLEQSRRDQRSSGRQLNSLNSEYDALKVKYNELIRPARSPEGRYLVEVRYVKSDGGFNIELATAEQPAFRSISQQQLDDRLRQLKQQQSNGLYIKVIIPEQSGLTYNEAWSFTSDLLASYDYYSQSDSDKPAAANEQQ